MSSWQWRGPSGKYTHGAVTFFFNGWRLPSRSSHLWLGTAVQMYPIVLKNTPVSGALETWASGWMAHAAVYSSVVDYNIIYNNVQLSTLCLC